MNSFEYELNLFKFANIIAVQILLSLFNIMKNN